jgi:hypothetical protein
MKKYYTIVLAKKPPAADEEDWPNKDNTNCTYVVNSKKALLCKAKELINNWAAPWWWIFDGDISEDNLKLSGAIDPDDIEIIKESF